MLQAWITSPRGSLYFAAPATAYNLETLRTHVRALRDEEAAATCLSLEIGVAEDEARAKVRALVKALIVDGIRVYVAGQTVRRRSAARRSVAVRSPRRVPA